MSDSRNIVTGMFVIAAITLSVTAYVVYPKPATTGMEEQVNKPLFEFEPKSVRGLSIVKYDQTRNQFDEILMENNLVNGWRIPSKSYYPVDSEDKLVNTAASLSGLVVLAIASEDPTDEETYGVVEPATGLKAGQEGVGVMVTLRNGDKQEIASVIIGKKVKDQPNNRFVRIPGQRVIYICEYDPSGLRTDFFSWINPKVLTWTDPNVRSGNVWAVSTLSLNSYVATKSPLLEVKKSYQAGLALEKNQWSTVSFVDAEKPGSKPNLNVAELERIRLALENFEIQDVVRKSPGLAKSLKDRTGIPVTFAIMSEVEKLGFFVEEKEDTKTELGAGGSLTFTSDTGIKFRLLFGALLAGQVTGKANDQRCVMVSADVDESTFPMPVKPGSGKKENGKKNDAPKPPGSGCDPAFQDDDDDREARRIYLAALDKRKEDIAAARKVVDGINERFADWFYIIDNKLYQALMPPKSEIISGN